MDPFATVHVFSLLLFISAFTTNLGFNVDTSHALTFPNNNHEGATYFGFSVALHENTIGSYLLVGAPRANTSSFYKPVKPVQPGAVYKCLLSDPDRHCEQIRFLQNNNSGTDEYYFKDLWDHSWLGGSLDVAPVSTPAITACAHLWKNQYYSKTYLPNGMCFTIDSELLASNIKRLMPMSRQSKQYLDKYTRQYSYGLAGMASHFVEGSADLAIGTPGVLNWTGTVAFVKANQFPKRIERQMFNIPSPLSSEDDSYVGYSVSSGSFSSNGNQVQLVTGAPRYGTTGAVFIIEVPLPHHTHFKRMMRKTLKGKQMGEYFGASVCAVDLNNDGYADLLVGAPSHSLDVDEGVVYVFMNTRDETVVSEKTTLFGPQRGARFGSAISGVGDLNQDGYQDVAVGAPYESGHGAVYIYHGSKVGPKLMQKILGVSVDSRLRGFGISISRGLDIDGNYVPDFAVGSYEAGYATVFRTYPVITLKSTINFNVSQVNLHTASCSLQSKTTACFRLTTCTSYFGQHAPVSVVLTQTFMIGSNKHTETRGFIIVDGDPEKKAKYEINLNKHEPACKEYDVHVLNSTQDFFTPLSFELTSEVTRNPRLEASFCNSCPVLNPDDDSTASAQISFATNCGEDDICHADLEVKAEVSGLTNTSFVVGSSHDIPVVLKVDVTNTGEPAYLTELAILLPQEVSFARKHSSCREEFQSDGSVKMLCRIGNPLPQNKNVEMEFPLDVSEVSVTVQELHFAFNVSTVSVDKNVENNFINISLPATAEADITIIPSTDTEQLMLPIQKKSPNAAKSTFLYHNFKVMKYGYSPINSVTVFINIPIQFEEAGTPYLEIMSVEAEESGLSHPSGGCHAITNTSLRTDSNNNANSFDTTLRTFDGKTLVLDCELSQCITVICNFGPFIDQEVANIKVGLKVFTQQLESILDGMDQIMLISFGKVVITDRNIKQPADGRPDLAEATTEFFKYGIPAPRKVANWIIPVCIAGGLLLLLLITFILAKLGFFRRTQKEEMDKLTQQNEDLLEEIKNKPEDNAS